jgi:hypothetical protein
MVFLMFCSTAHGNAKAACWKYVGFLYENIDAQQPIDDKRYYCSVCLEEQKKLGTFHISKVASFSSGTSSGNINKHLLDKHEIVVDSTVTAVPLILNYISRRKRDDNSGDGVSSSSRCIDITQHEFNREVLIWFVRDLIAFENVGKPGFNEFMKKMLPNLGSPTPQTLAGTALNDVYVTVLTKVKEELSKVRSICVMADGWTDRYHGRSYVGIRVSFVKDWEYRLLTLSCHAMAGSHTGDALSAHVKSVLSQFIPDFKKVIIATCHDGAANMMKTSQLLRVQSVQHCVAHALHLLITVDSLYRVDDLKSLIEKCRNIVTALHFKSDLLEDEEASQADHTKLNELRQKIAGAQEIIDLDDQFPVMLDRGQNTENSGDSEDDQHGDSGTNNVHYHQHQSLKGSCPTRWNSILVMLESITDLHKSVDNSLKKIGKVDLCITSNEFELLRSVQSFLKDFEKFTEIVSSSVPVLSIVPLMKVKIKRMCQEKDDDDDAMTDLKRLIMQNVDRRLPENEFMKISQVLDPMTKDIFSEKDAVDLIMKAFILATQRGIMASSAAATTGNSARQNVDCTETSVDPVEVGFVCIFLSELTQILYIFTF